MIENYQRRKVYTSQNGRRRRIYAFSQTFNKQKDTKKSRHDHNSGNSNDNSALIDSNNKRNSLVSRGSSKQSNSKELINIHSIL